jgi:hypothetical protein
MKVEKIKLCDDIVLHKYNINYNQQIATDEVYMSVDTYELTSINRPTQPGIQTSIIVKNGEIESISNTINNIILNEFYKDNTISYVEERWVYISSPNNPTSYWHNHSEVNYMKGLVGEWTYTFYIQMPDNLKGKDGYLQFKDESNNVYSILPKEGEVYIFDSKYLHKPKTNTSSKKDRIVLAGTICKVNPEKHRRKSGPTLM